MRPASLRGSMVAATSARQHALAHGLGADLVVIEAAAVVLHAELIAVGARARELHGDRADFRLVLHHAIGRRFDAVANRVVDELAENLLDGATIAARHVLEPDDHQRDALGVHVGEERGHLLEAFLRQVGKARGFCVAAPGCETVVEEAPGPRSCGWRMVVPVAVAERCVTSNRRGRSEAVLHAPLAQARDHLALDGEMAQQVVELHRERQEIVA